MDSVLYDQRSSMVGRIAVRRPTGRRPAAIVFALVAHWLDLMLSVCAGGGGERVSRPPGSSASCSVVGAQLGGPAPQRPSLAGGTVGLRLRGGGESKAFNSSGGSGDAGGPSADWSTLEELQREMRKELQREMRKLNAPSESAELCEQPDEDAGHSDCDAVTVGSGDGDSTSSSKGGSASAGPASGDGGVDPLALEPDAVAGGLAGAGCNEFGQLGRALPAGGGDSKKMAQTSFTCARPASCQALAGAAPRLLACGARHTVAVVSGTSDPTAARDGGGEMAPAPARELLLSLGADFSCGRLGRVGAGDSAHRAAWGAVALPRALEGQRLRQVGAPRAPRPAPRAGHDGGAGADAGAGQVACGEAHSVVVTEAGDVAVWGANSQGQLGLGVGAAGHAGADYTDRPTATRWVFPRGVACLFCGWHGFLILGCFLRLCRLMASLFSKWYAFRNPQDSSTTLPNAVCADGASRNLQRNRMCGLLRFWPALGSRVQV